MLRGKVRIQVSKARDGVADYVQIMSADSLSVNIVLVVQDGIELQDDRSPQETVAQETAMTAPLDRAGKGEK